MTGENILMKIKITSYTNEKAWYKDHVGEVFETHTKEPFEMPLMGMVHWVKGRPFSYVRIGNCEIVKDEQIEL